MTDEERGFGVGRLLVRILTGVWHSLICGLGLPCSSTWDYHAGRIGSNRLKAT